MHYILDLDPIRPVGVVGVGAAGEAAGYDGRRWFIRRAGRNRCYDRFENFMRDFITEHGETGETVCSGQSINLD